MKWTRKIRLDDFIFFYIGVSMIYAYQNEMRISRLTKTINDHITKE